MIKRLIRLYLMANAPAKPQDWFEPSRRLGRPVPPVRPADLTPAEKHEIEAWNEVGMKPEAMQQPRARTYCESIDSHKVAARRWDARQEYLRLAQWPAAWAEAVMRETK